MFSKHLRFYFRKFLFVFIPLLVLVLLVFVIRNRYGILSRAFGRNANILVDAGSSFSSDYSYTWRNLAQGGEENGRMLACCIAQISKLKPEYIRIDHVLDYYNVVSRDENNNLIFDWTQLDLTLADIKSAGAKPFISISYMPNVISSGSVTDLPKDWSEWELVVQKLVEHISGKSELSISDVYYEVWNEPDLFGKLKAKGDNKNYLDLYYHTHKGIMKASNVLPFKVGGPATTGHYKNWLEALVDFASKNFLRFDFYSYHTYSFDLSRFENDVDEVRKILANSNYKDIEILITEFGITGDNDKRYDTSFSAIHNMAVYSVVEGKLNRVFAFEIKDGIGSEKYWGRWGLLTHEKWGTPEEKPRYLSFDFLNKMEGDKVNVAGFGTWVKGFAKEDNQIIRLLLVNYDPQGKHYEAVPIKFINLPFGAFKYARQDFQGGKTERSVNIDSDIWEVVEGMNPNTAFILELSPLTP